MRIIGSKDRLVYGLCRRHMKTIGYLGQIDRHFGAPGLQQRHFGRRCDRGNIVEH